MLSGQIQKDDPVTELSVQDSQGRNLVPQGNENKGGLVEFFGRSMAEAVHNFKGTTQELWKFTALATAPGAKTMDDVPDAPLEVEYIYCHKVPIQGPTEGEITEAIRTVLITSDGERYAFVSNGIAQDAARIFMAFGFQKFSPPITLRVEEFQTNNKRKMYTLVPV